MLKTYDFSQVSVILGGITLSGFHEGTPVKVAYDEDAFSLLIGADGDGARSKTNNRSGTITFSLLQTSAANAQLSALHALDIAGKNGDGVVPLLIKDNSGFSLHTAQTAWIKKFADATYGRDTEVREWTIQTDNLDSLIGGN